MHRRQRNIFLRLVPAALLLVALAMPPARAVGAARIPVILDSDIGDDIDDTWALGFLLRCPELDVKLVIGDHGKNLYRARLLAKFLERVGRTDIPVGIGVDRNATGDGPQAEWVKDYDLNRYRGCVYPDGVRAMIDVIMKSKRPVTVIAIGPVPNLAVALEREPKIAQQARFVGMHGSVRLGYGGKAKPDAEYNVKADVKACQRAFTAAWDMTITPLDTCGLVQLDGPVYHRLVESKDPVAVAILENYRLWSARQNPADGAKVAATRSSILFDTVAVYLAFTQERLKIERLGIRVTDDGFTVMEAAAKPVNVATEWKDRPGFNEFLVDRLTGARRP